MVFPAEAPWNKRLKLVRVNKELTQEDLAKLLGTTRKQIYLWEKGRTVPNSYTRQKLSRWAGVPEEILFKGAD